MNNARSTDDYDPLAENIDQAALDEMLSQAIVTSPTGRERRRQAPRDYSVLLSQVCTELHVRAEAVRQLIANLSAGDISRPTLQRDLAAGRRNANYLSAVTDDLMDYARIQSREIVIASEQVNLNHLLSRLVERSILASGEQGASIAIKVANTAPARVLTDRPRLVKMLAHIVTTALEICKKEPLLLEVTSEAIDSRGGDPQLNWHSVCFSVSKTSVDIKQLSFDKILAGGSGVISDLPTMSPARLLRGAVAQGLCEIMRGNMYTRQGGEGSELISVTIPLRVGADQVHSEEFRLATNSVLPGETMAVEVIAKQAAEAQPQAAPIGARNATKSRVRLLSIDDVERMRCFSRDMLREKDLAPDIALTAKVAVQKVKSNRYDLILVFLQPGGTDWRECIREMKASMGTDKCASLVAVCSSSNGIDTESYRRAGIDEIVTHPVNWQDIDCLLLQRPQDVARTSDTVLTEVLTGADDADAAIDFVYLDRQLGSLASVILARTAPAFLASVARRLANFQSLYAAKDTERLREMANSWKGSAMSVGARCLAELLDGVEKHAASGQVPGDGQITQLKTMVNAVVLGLESHLNKTENTSGGLC